MTVFKEIEKHVIDDAVELVATLGVATPLIRPLAYEVDEERQKVARFLRATLSRHVILVATRLHAPKGTGPTGETASINSYLYYAEAEDALTSAQADEFRSKRKAVVAKLEREGIPFADLLTFRHSELAHSLHRTLPFENQLNSLPIWDFSYDTYELVLAIERGASGTSTLERKFHEWQDRGNTFWSVTEDNSDYTLPQDGI